MLVSAVEKALAALKPPVSSAPTVQEIWNVYCDEHVRHLAPSGQSMVRYSWKNLQAYFGNLRASDVTQDRVNEYHDLRTVGALGRPSKAVTVRRELAYLFAALKYGARRRIISFDDIAEPTLPAPAPTAKQVLAIDQLQKLLEAAADARLLDGRMTKLERFVWIALETGARKSAILRLTWDRVDLEQGCIDFREPGMVPTKKRRVAVAISTSLRGVLERAMRERQTTYVLDNCADTVWAAMQITAARAFGGPATAKGQCPQGTGIGPHTLRHTAASLMARNGVPLFLVAGVLGNTTQMVERVYAHHAPADPAAVNKITEGRIPPPRD